MAKAPVKKTKAAKAPTAAVRLVECLLAHGVDHVFCVPGESYLAVLDALWDVRDRIKVVACRHEAGAANMAEAYGKLTGKPGICMVTLGPGATHASLGVHTAQQDSTPMILFVGQNARSDKGRGAFQEVDYGAAFGPLAKWAAEIDEADRVSELVSRAFAVAPQGRQGPVVLALPEDMLVEDASGPAPTPVPSARAGLDPDFVSAVAARLAKAERPILILGGSGWTQGALARLMGFVEVHAMPVVLSFRRKDLISNDHPCYAGDLGLGPNPKLIERIKASDLVIAVGARLGENPTKGRTLFTREQTAERLIRIHPGPEELGRVWPASLSACADVSLAAVAPTRAAPELEAVWLAGDGDFPITAQELDTALQDQANVSVVVVDNGTYGSIR